GNSRALAQWTASWLLPSGGLHLRAVRGSSFGRFRPATAFFRPDAEAATREEADSRSTWRRTVGILRPDCPNWRLSRFTLQLRQRFEASGSAGRAICKTG